jgi:hypothetical protein
MKSHRVSSSITDAEGRIVGLEVLDARAHLSSELLAKAP